jgi:hypothetical protein
MQLFICMRSELERWISTRFHTEILPYITLSRKFLNLSIYFPSLRFLPALGYHFFSFGFSSVFLQGFLSFSFLGGRSSVDSGFAGLAHHSHDLRGYFSRGGSNLGVGRRCAGHILPESVLQSCFSFTIRSVRGRGSTGFTIFLLSNCFFSTGWGLRCPKLRAHLERCCCDPGLGVGGGLWSLSGYG